MEPVSGTSPRQLARMAGGLYLLNILAGAFAIGVVPAALGLSGDVATSLRNIQSNELLYRLGLAAHLIPIVCNVALVVILYDLFKVVDRRIALMMVFYSLVGTAVETANLLNQFTPLVLLDRAQALGMDRVQDLAYAPLGLVSLGYDVQQVVYSFYLLAAGYLVFRSTFVPRVIGVLLAIGAVAYLIYSFASFLAPAFSAQLVPYIQLPSLIGEASLSLSLLAIGVNVRRWREQASVARHLGAMPAEALG
jgi:hypothetical protein